MKKPVSRVELLKIANEELQEQPFYRPGQEITGISMLGNGVIVLRMPTDGTDFSMLSKEHQAFAHSLGGRYELIDG